MIYKIRHIFIFLGLISTLNLVGCGSKNDMYVDACRALRTECSNAREFDREIKKVILAELEQREGLLVKSVNKINSDLKSHIKEKFLVDLTTHIREPGRSLDWFKTDQLSKQRIYDINVPLKKSTTQVRVFDGEFEIRMDLTPNKGFTSLREICSRYPDQLCKVLLTGELDAVKGKSREGTQLWRGWIDITGYSAQAVSKSAVADVLFSDIRIASYREIESGRSNSISEFIKNSIEVSLKSFLKSE